MGKTHIRCSSSAKAEILDHLSNGKKIAAIKHLREVGTAWTDGVRENKPGLKHAKHAVEVLNGEMSVEDACAVIATIPKVKRVVVDTGGGEMELDLDGLQLRLLDGLATVPIDMMADSLRLMQILRAFDRGELDATFGVSDGKTEAE